MIALTFVTVWPITGTEVSRGADPLREALWIGLDPATHFPPAQTPTAPGLDLVAEARDQLLGAALEVVGRELDEHLGQVGQ